MFLGERFVKFNGVDKGQYGLVAGVVKLGCGLKCDTCSVYCERHVAGVVKLERLLQFKTGAGVVIGSQRAVERVA